MIVQMQIEYLQDLKANLLHTDTVLRGSIHLDNWAL